MSLPSSITAAGQYDSGSDDPKQARPQLKAMRDELAQILAHLQASPLLSPATPLGLGDGVQSSGGNLVVKLDGGTLVVAAAGLKLADDGVDLAQLAHATAGDLLYYGASGVPQRLAKGSDGQVLSLASGLPSWAGASGGWSFVSSSSWTSGNKLSVALDSDAGTIQEIEVTDLRPGSADAELTLDVSDDDEATWESGIVQYGYTMVAGSSVSGSATNGVDEVPLTGGIRVESDSNDNNQVSGRLTLRRARDSGAFAHLEWALQWGLGSTTWHKIHGVAIFKHSAALTHLRFGWSGGATGGAGGLTLRKIAAPTS